jgi:hypothetical protein
VSGPKKKGFRGELFNKIFIVVMTANIEARAKLETDLAAAAAANGYNAVTSIDVMPPAFSDPVLLQRRKLPAK